MFPNGHASLEAAAENCYWFHTFDLSRCPTFTNMALQQYLDNGCRPATATDYHYTHDYYEPPSYATATDYHYTHDYYEPPSYTMGWDQDASEDKQMCLDRWAPVDGNPGATCGNRIDWLKQHGLTDSAARQEL